MTQAQAQQNLTHPVSTSEVKSSNVTIIPLEYMPQFKKKIVAHVYLQSSQHT